MWPKFYRDYPVDTPMIQDPVEPSHGIIGCEMHEINGWGNTLHLFPGERKQTTKDKRDAKDIKD